MTEKPEFAFEKKISIPSCLYGDIEGVNRGFLILLQCMKETNKIHGLECEFFRFDFRQPYLDEGMTFPLGSLICHLKWGSKKEWDDKLEKNSLRT